MRGASVVDSSKQSPNPDTVSITAIAWNALGGLSAVESGPIACHGLQKHISENWNLWRRWLDLENPMEETLPGEWQEKVKLVCCFFFSSFQMSIIIFI